MPIAPALLPLIDAFGHVPEAIPDPGAFRYEMNAANEAAFSRFGAPGPQIGAHRTVAVDIAGRRIRVDLFHPSTPGPHSVHVFLHGGGWIMNTSHCAEAVAAARARSAGGNCIVASVDYSKSPEHPFPIPIDDAIGVIDWLAYHAEDLGAVPGQLSIGGQSSGANIAAGVAVTLRDRGRNDLVFQLLEVPVLDLTHTIDRPHGNEWPLTLTDVHRLSALYASPAAARDPRASPLLADDLARLPPALIAVAEYDVLRPDGEQYAARLSDAGVPVEVYLGRGHVHMSPSMTGLLGTARDWQVKVSRALKSAHSAAAAAPSPAHH